MGISCCMIGLKRGYISVGKHFFNLFFFLYLFSVEELQHRNSMLPPHLRSTYAAQYDHEVDENDLKVNNLPNTLASHTINNLSYIPHNNNTFFANSNSSVNANQSTNLEHQSSYDGGQPHDHHHNHHHHQSHLHHHSYPQHHPYQQSKNFSSNMMKYKNISSNAAASSRHALPQSHKEQQITMNLNNGSSSCCNQTNRKTNDPSSTFDSNANSSSFSLSHHNLNNMHSSVPNTHSTPLQKKVHPSFIRLLQGFK